jgi:hypothetical protein
MIRPAPISSIRSHIGLFFSLVTDGGGSGDLDVDTYKSTLSCLEFFYPRTSTGGIILSHDYLNAVGVTKAFQEFFEERREPIISLTGKQCLIMKLSACKLSY